MKNKNHRNVVISESSCNNSVCGTLCHEFDSDQCLNADSAAILGTKSIRPEGNPRNLLHASDKTHPTLKPRVDFTRSLNNWGVSGSAERINIIQHWFSIFLETRLISFEILKLMSLTFLRHFELCIYSLIPCVWSGDVFVLNIQPISHFSTLLVHCIEMNLWGRLHKKGIRSTFDWKDNLIKLCHGQLFRYTEI